MTHALEALLGKRDAVVSFADRWEHAEPSRRPLLVVLPQDFALVLCTHSLRRDIRELAGLPSSRPYAELERLTSSEASVFAESSLAGPLGYVETEYFGGTGSQAAVLWERGRVTLGPLRFETIWDESTQAVRELGTPAINAVLAKLGVSKRPGEDEFDALGLGRLRSMPE
jgi:hypothetical protein